jgi:predicted RecB family nuclease
LFGLYYEEEGKKEYKLFWAHNKEQEKNNLIQFFEFIDEHFKKYPDSFVYHYGNYEIDALERLTQDYNQKEIVANLAPVLTSITDNTSKIVKQIGKKRTTAALNELQQWLATGTGSISNLSNDSRKILGYTSWYQKLFRARPESPHVLFKQPVEDQITGFFNTFKTQNPAEYKKMINKMSRQVENLKVQVHWTRNLTPESIIKYKTILES